MLLLSQYKATSDGASYGKSSTVMHKILASAAIASRCRNVDKHLASCCFVPDTLAMRSVLGCNGGVSLCGLGGSAGYRRRIC